MASGAGKNLTPTEVAQQILHLRSRRRPISRLFLVSLHLKITMTPSYDDIIESLRKRGFSASESGNPAGPLRQRCAHCSATGERLIQCTDCHAVRYCGDDHLLADKPQHEERCNEVKKARARLAEEEHYVRNAEAGLDTPANAFETHVGAFDRFPSTRNYLFARQSLAKDHLLKLGTLDSVTEALEHMIDMLKLDHGDNYDVRRHVPNLLLRLDMDFECYEFFEKETLRRSGGESWNDVSWPHSDLNIRRVDVLGDLDSFSKEPMLVSFGFDLILLRMKLLVDVINLKILRKVLAPRGIIYDVACEIEQRLIRSPLSAKFVGNSFESLCRAQSTLLKQIHGLTSPPQENTWRTRDVRFALLIPQFFLWDIPFPSLDPMRDALDAWFEMQGVSGLLRDAYCCAERMAPDPSGQHQDLVSANPFGNVRGPLILNNPDSEAWNYLEYVTEDACYLGPPSERPSITRMQKRQRAESSEAERGADMPPVEMIVAPMRLDTRRPLQWRREDLEYQEHFRKTTILVRGRDNKLTYHPSMGDVPKFIYFTFWPQR